MCSPEAITQQYQNVTYKLYLYLLRKIAFSVSKFKKCILIYQIIYLMSKIRITIYFYLLGTRIQHETKHMLFQYAMLKTGGMSARQWLVFHSPYAISLQIFRKPQTEELCWWSVRCCDSLLVYFIYLGFMLLSFFALIWGLSLIHI